MTEALVKRVVDAIYDIMSAGQVGSTANEGLS